MSPFEFALVLASALLHAGWSATIKGSRDPLVFNLRQEVPVLVLALMPRVADRIRHQLMLIAPDRGVLHRALVPLRAMEAATGIR